MTRVVPDLTGLTFGRLRVISRLATFKWFCKCSCGEFRFINGDQLRKGKIVSCGCYSIELLIARSTRHGARKTREYTTWVSMKQRCTNPKHKHYKHYGLRGIKICDRWINSFPNFLADMGHIPSTMTLDRIDNNGNYEPSNCKWSTVTEQNRNKSNIVYLTFNGQTKTQKDWANELNILASTISKRHIKGRPIEEILSISRLKCKSKQRLTTNL